MLLTRNSGAKVVIPFGSCNYLTDYLTFPNKKASRYIGWESLAMPQKKSLAPSLLRERGEAHACIIKPLHDALCHHGVCHLHESGDVGALDVVDVTVGLCAILHALVVDAVHDGMQLLVDFGSAPAEVHGVL